jgi:hypothetical protein
MGYSFSTIPNNVTTYWPPNLLLLGTDPHQSLAFLAQKYGRLMYVPLGSIPTFVVSSPVMSKEFLKTHDHVFVHPISLCTTSLQPQFYRCFVKFFLAILGQDLLNSDLHTHTPLCFLSL